jgi:hypothetical protein
LQHRHLQRLQQYSFSTGDTHLKMDKGRRIRGHPSHQETRLRIMSKVWLDVGLQVLCCQLLKGSVSRKVRTELRILKEWEDRSTPSPAVMSLFTHFGGANKQRTINLGNSSGTSSPDSVIARARAERQARERLRKEEVAARKIQRIWRGRKVAQRTRQELLGQLKNGNLQHEQAARALAVILWNGIGSPDDLQGLRMLSSWAEAACAESSGQSECVPPRGKELMDGMR